MENLKIRISTPKLCMTPLIRPWGITFVQALFSFSSNYVTVADLKFANLKKIEQKKMSTPPPPPFFGFWPFSPIFANFCQL